MNATKKRKITKKGYLLLGAILICILISLTAFLIIQQKKSSAVSPPEVITVSTLEKIINVKELSTFTAVYNGIASVGDTENDKQPDYYVSYEARVKAGIVMDDVQIAVDNNNKVITVTLPNVEITEINVDISSLDFIFYNLKANPHPLRRKHIKPARMMQKKKLKRKKPFSRWQSKMQLT